MYELEPCYGKKAFDFWNKEYVQTVPGGGRATSLPSFSLANHKSRPVDNEAHWTVRSYCELADAVAFLTSMNKREALFFRGQMSPHDPIPGIFRKRYTVLGGHALHISDANRPKVFAELANIGRDVADLCLEHSPRRLGLRTIREVQWAIIQHYGLWPTPLIDITYNLRVAASFALNHDQPHDATDAKVECGYIYVVSLPHPDGSISFNIDQHTVVARLMSACPPVARRPHFQDGFLVGRFPFEQPDKETSVKSRLCRRLVACFKLENTSTNPFFCADFPAISASALMPNKDTLLKLFSTLNIQDRIKAIP